MKSPIVSIAIPALNEEKYIANCLDSLFDQTVSKDKYEVIVALSKKTTDSTEKIIKKYDAKIVWEDGSVGFARYMGFKDAKGKILAGTDADTVVPSNWIETIIKNFENPDVVSVTGPVLTLGSSKPLHKIAFWLGTGVYKAVSTIDRRAYMAGMNYAVRAEAYHKCGGFNPNIKSAEDTDLTIRISKYGKTIFDPNMKVYTSTRRLKEGYFRSFTRYSKNFVMLKLGKQPPGFPHYR